MHASWARSEEEEEEEEEEKKKKKKKKMMMMIGFLDGMNVHHKYTARGRSVI
jgi:CO dehydrogenase/acetyl-CoA synthase beta subunit